LALDDFGTGFSSLSQLKRLPLHELKIDKSFVMQLDTDEDDQSIVRSTIELGHSLGLSVVAEGVENQESLNLLGEMRCDTIQGYFLGRPMTAPDFEKWIGGRLTGTDPSSLPSDVEVSKV
jgi:EAL domain-containing protein (putative c-di-GMP-specific phosphodiesterase class I)